jgi:HEAT repeat protein
MVMDQELPRDLQQALVSPAVDERKKAIGEVVKQRLRRGIPALERLAVSDRVNEVRYMARKAVDFLRQDLLVDTGTGVDAQIAEHLSRLTDTLEQVRLDAVQVLARIGSAQAIAPLTELVAGEPSAAVRAEVAHALGACTDPAHRAHALASLAQLLKDREAEVRTSALAAVEKLDGQELAPAVLECLLDEEQNIQDKAQELVQFWGSQAIVTAAHSMLLSTRLWTREAAVVALARSGSIEALPVLQRALGDPAPMIRERARHALEAWSGPGVPDLSGPVAPPPQTGAPGPAQALESPDAVVRLEAVTALQDKAAPEAISVLLGHLPREEDPFVLSALILALARLGAVEAVTALLPYVEHTNDRVRANAVEALGTLAEQLRRRLIPLLEDPSNRVSANAIIACHRLAGVDVRPALRRLLTSEAAAPRRSGVYAILNLGDPELDQLLRDAPPPSPDRGAAEPGPLPGGALSRKP